MGTTNGFSTMTGSLDLSFTLKDGKIEVLVLEPESGERRTLTGSTEAINNFVAEIGSEINSWLFLWMDEEEEKQNEI